MTWEYIAGFFDGEGTITYNGKGYRINIPQTNKTVLDNIRSFINIGGVCKVTKRQPHWKESWVYFIAKQDDIYKFVKGVLPYLIVKRSKVKKYIPELLLILRMQQKRRKAHNDKFKKALNFRRHGLSYRKIGLKMKMDHGYIRRLILSNGGRSSTG